MAMSDYGPNTEIFSNVIASGRAHKPRPDHAVDGGGAGQAGPADGNFLGNVHKGAGADPAAYADPTPAGGESGTIASTTGGFEIPSDGISVTLPLLPEFDDYGISIQISGVPESTTLSSGRSLGAGRWMLDQAEMDNLRLLPSNGADGADLPGPLSLGVSVTVTDASTGDVKVVPGETIELGADQLGPVSAVSDTDVAADSVSESALDGDSVGITAAASDPDFGDVVTYRLVDDAGGRFAIDPNTGAVTVADASLLDYESAPTHTIVVEAASTDGSSTTQLFTISLLDDTSEFAVTPISDTNPAAETVSESVADGTLVGITAFASDADSSDSVSYSLADDAGGRFAIDPATGAVTVADASLLDYEAATSHTITVVATSTDGSTASRDFTISLTDDTGEFAVSAISDTNAAAETISESASIGDVVGITAFASDGDATDSVTYSLTDDAGGRFAIDPSTGVVTVADPSLLDFESATSHTITVQALSSDGSAQTRSFAIAVSDDTSEFSVSPVADADVAANTISESTANGDPVGITASAVDLDATDSVSYSLTDDAGGRFAIDSATGVVTVADASLLDYETATSHTITVQVTSTDGSTQTQTFTIGVSDDTSEASVSAVSDSDVSGNAVSESASNGDVVGITAFASDADGTDTVSYSLTDDAGGRFAIDASTGVVTVADASLLDYESATSHTITVQATSTDGSTQTQSFTIGISDDTSEFSVSAISDADASGNAVSESASNGDVVGITAFASDADATDTVSYSLADDAGGRFAIDSATGVVTVADASLLDYETATSHTITVQATSTDGSTQTQSFTIALSDDTSEFSVSAISDTDASGNVVSESASNGDVVGITAFASDADATDTVSYSLTDDAGGRFAIDSATGVVTVADASLLDSETATSHAITVQAISTDGSTRTQTFTIGVSDDTSEFSVSAISDADTTADGIAENAATGDVVGITALAVDADSSDSVSYSLTDDAGGRFAIDPSTGEVTVADGSLLDYETATSHTITVQATSSDGSISTENFTIPVNNVNEAPTAASVDGPAPAAGAVLHLDATDIDADGNGADNPGDGTAVSRWEDSSANNLDAVQKSGAPVVASGAINGNDAIDFSGASDALQVPDDADINLSTISERSFAIAFETGDDVSGFQVIFEEGGGVRGYNLAIAGDPANGGQPTLWAFVWNNAEWAGGDQYKAINLGTVEANETYNVVMVHDASAADPTDRTFSAYVNGDFAGALSNVDVQRAHSGDIGIGGYLNDTVNPVTNAGLGGDGGEFNGKVGEVLIWNDALDSQQISETSSYLNEKWVGTPSVGESAPDGTAVFAVSDIVDQDAGETYTYALADDAGGRFTIDPATGIVTVADASLLDYDTAQSHDVSVRVTDSGGNTLDIPVTIQVGIGNAAPVGAISDTDAAADGVSESASNGDVVGITAFASDADVGDTVSYTLTDDAGGRFAIDSATGVVTVADASLLDYESATNHTITVEATSTDGSTQTKTFSISVSDDTSEFSVSAVSDTDAAADTVSEGASNGDVVGITAFASDADSSDTVSYSLTDDAGGRFAIDSATGVVTVADASLLDYETATSHTITVQATSTDGSAQTQSFTIALSDDTSEFAVSAISDTDATADSVSEGASNGDVVGITAFASDTDASDTVSYSLTDDAGGRFAIDASTGVVTVADASLLDYETATSHTITVQATSTDGSTQTQSFTVGISDDNSEFSVSAVSDADASANTVGESASNGDVVGVTAFASDADGSDSVSYSLTDDAGGRFAIDASTGVVTVADASLLDYESATSHTITVQATSTDGSTQTQSFSIGLSDDTSEFSVSAVSDTDATANTVSEGASNGDVVGITAFASDADSSDTVSYSLTDDAGGRFAIDPSTGVVTVADASLLDYETATSHTITVQATSTDGSTQTQSFTIGLSDDTSEFSVSAISDSDASSNAVSESASNGDVVGVTAFASDADVSDTVSYSLTDDAGGRFAIDSATGVVTVADASLLDYESATSHTITVQATSTDGSTQTQSFAIGISDDASEFSVSTVSDTDAAANTVSEGASNGDVVGITAFASDADGSDTVSYSLADDAGGRFTIDASTGVVTVADSSLLDYESATSHTITVQATSTDGSTQTQSFTVGLSDDTSEFSVSAVSDTDAAANAVSESVSNGDVVGVTAFASDADGSDTVSYSLTDDAGGRFAIGSATGVVTVADASLLDYESATSHTITVQATSTDGSTQTQSFTIGVSDDTSEFTVSAISDTDAAANTVSEGASNGDVVGITAFASDADGSDTVSYSLTDDAGGRFAIDSATGVVTVADASLLDYETTTNHTITVQATSTDGSTQTQSFTIGVSDDTSEYSVSAISDTDAAANSVSESASNGDVVGLIAFASDADAGDSVSYGLTDDASGRFTIDPSTGVVTVADASLLDYETATNHTITVQATSTDGSTATKSFVITLSDDTGEFGVSAVSDSDATTNSVSEGASNGDVVGVTALASDGDASDTVTYSLADDAGGRFAINSSTGVVTVADASLLDYESATSHTITIQATSTDGSTATQDFTIGVGNVVEAASVSTSDSSGDEDTAIALDISVSDLDAGATHTVTITGVPSGATLSAGTDQGGGTWTLTTAQVSGLTITPPADSDADFQLDVTVTSDDGSGPVTSSTETIDVTVDAVADAPALTLTHGYAENLTSESTFEIGGSSGGFVSGSLDGWSAIPGSEIEIWNENDVAGDAYEGDEFIELNYEGSGTYADAGGIERTISTEADAPYELSFQVSPRPGFESYMDFEVRAIDVSSGDVLKTMTITWDGNDVSELTWTEYSMRFVGTGGDVQLVFEDIGAVHDYGRGAYVDDIRLSDLVAFTASDTIDMSELISVGLTDTDGSETLGDVEISNIPNGAVMAVGGTPIDTSGGSVSVTTSQLANLTMQAPAGFSGDLYLDVTVTSTEAENGDTATTTDTLTISVASNDENMDSMGSSSGNYISGGSGDDTLYGGGGNDTIYGNAGEDVLYGGSGNDRLYGGDDNDTLMGGDGRDRLYGNAGDDFLYGGDGDDRLYGSDGDDTLYGGGGDDRLDGGAGDDLLIGGEGNDTVSGGDGDDTFIFGDGWGNDSFDGGGGAWTDTIHISGREDLTAYSDWTLTGATVVDSGDDYLQLADDSDGTITLDDGSQLTFTDVDRIEW